MAPRLHVNGNLATTAGVLAAGLAVGRWLLHESRRIDFKDRHVLITGGSRGLGLVLAREFASENARVAICGRDETELENARAELAEAGAKVHAFVGDMTNAAQVRQLIPSIEAEGGPIDVVVNNAGLFQVGPYDSMTIDEYERAMRTHFWGPLYVIQTILPTMRARHFGRIVNIASIGGKVSVPHLLPYSASKFALVGLSEGLRAELAKDNVFVTTVCPGLVRTGGPHRAPVNEQQSAEYALFTAGDAGPVRGASAVRAARRIVEACRYAEAEVVIGAPARAAAWFHGLLPGITSEALGILNRLLPKNRPPINHEPATDR
jgi:NAD(P)-dependent dehydrogenase (short-subunit alcohol dehydrogenase family)